MDIKEIANMFEMTANYYKGVGDKGHFYGYSNLANACRTNDDVIGKLSRFEKVPGIADAGRDKILCMLRNEIPESVTTALRYYKDREVKSTPVVTNPHKHPTHRDVTAKLCEEVVHGLGLTWYCMGSWRRGCELNGDGDILIPYKKNNPYLKVLRRIKSKPNRWNLTAEGDNKLKLEVLNEGMMNCGVKNVIFEIDVRFLPYESLGSTLLMMTGPMEFNVVCRSNAKSLGLKLNEYGLFDSKGNTVCENTEIDILRHLHMEEWIDPTSRQKWKK